jgi:hypothetical protein
VYASLTMSLILSCLNEGGGGREGGGPVLCTLPGLQIEHSVRSEGEMPEKSLRSLQRCESGEFCPCIRLLYSSILDTEISL